MKNRIVKELLGGLAMAAMAFAIIACMVKVNEVSAGAAMQRGYAKSCEEAGEEYNICPELIMAVIGQEPEGDPDGVGQALMGLSREYKDIGEALAAYYGMEGAQGRGGKEELEVYVQKIMERARELEIQHKK